MAEPVDRRAARRVQTDLKVDFKFGARSTDKFDGVASDISESGLFLHTDAISKPGSEIYMKIYLRPGGKGGVIGVVGEVARVVSPGEGRLPGLGVHFLTLFSEQREQLNKFVEDVLHRMRPEEDSIAKVELKGGSSVYGVDIGPDAVRKPRRPEGAMRKEYEKIHAAAGETTLARGLGVVTKILAVLALLLSIAYLILKILHTTSG